MRKNDIRLDVIENDTLVNHEKRIDKIQANTNKVATRSVAPAPSVKPTPRTTEARDPDEPTIESLEARIDKIEDQSR